MRGRLAVLLAAAAVALVALVSPNERTRVRFVLQTGTLRAAPTKHLHCGGRLNRYWSGLGDGRFRSIRQQLRPRADDKDGWIGRMTSEEVKRQLRVICEMLGVDPPPPDMPDKEMIEALAVTRSRAANRVPIDQLKPTPVHPKGYPIVTVDIEGFGEAKFAIHTGANINIVSEKLANEAKAQGNEVPGLGSGGVQQRKIVTMPKMSIGERALPEILRTAAIAPIHPALEEMGVKGMLGTKFLEAFDVEIIFPKRKSKISNNSTEITRDEVAAGIAGLSDQMGLISGGAMVLYPPGWAEKKLIDVRHLSTVTCIPLLGGIPAAVLTLGEDPKKVPLPAVVDLGSPFSLLNEAGRKALDLNAVDTGLRFANQPISALPLNGELPVSAVPESGGEGDLKPLKQVMIGDAGVFQSLQLTEAPAGLIGLDILGEGRLVLSMATQKLWAEPPKPDPDSGPDYSRVLNKV